MRKPNRRLQSSTQHRGAGRHRVRLFLLLFSVFLPGALSANDEVSPVSSEAYFRIAVRDADTGRGVPLARVVLSTAGIEYYTDSAGVVAFYEPGAMNRDVFFEVQSDGYRLKGPGAESGGVLLTPQAGGEAIVEMDRLFPAQRIYRVTGLGRYRDSVLLGDREPGKTTLLNASVVGQDSVYVEKFRGDLFWFWGDTASPGGRGEWNLEVTAATTECPPGENADAEVGLEYNYYEGADGRTRKMIAPEDGGTITWLDGLVNIPDKDNRERLFVHYLQMRRVPLPPGLRESPQGEYARGLSFFWLDDKWAREVEKSRLLERGLAPASDNLAAASRYTLVTRGLAEFNPDRRYFEFVEEFPERELEELHVGAHAFKHTDEGVEYVYYPGLYPNRRVRADVDALADIEEYESFSCLVEGSRWEEEPKRIDRLKDSSPRYAWKRNTSPIDPERQKQLVEKGLVEKDDRWIGFRDVETGDDVHTHHNTVRWNRYRNRWIGLFTEQKFEDEDNKTLGETWYAEADTPVGPWGYMAKIATFKRYSFYNLCHSPHLNKDNGREIFFEGTYTTFMTGRADRVPRYNYNQIMYKMELDDPRLFLPVPVYRTAAGELATAENIEGGPGEGIEIAFHAPDRPRKGTVPIYAYAAEDGAQRLATSSGPSRRIAFYAESADRKEISPNTTPLYERASDGGGGAYSIDGGANVEEPPLCYVWKNPTRFNPYRSDSGAAEQ